MTNRTRRRATLINNTDVTPRIIDKNEDTFADQYFIDSQIERERQEREREKKRGRNI